MHTGRAGGRFVRARATAIGRVAGVTAVAMLVGCSDDAPSSDAAISTSPAVTTAPLPVATSPVGENDTSYPVEVVDCEGRATTYEQAPQRVVTLDESIAETLVLLGFGDTIVGVVRESADADLWPLTSDLVLSRQVIAEASTSPTQDDVERVGPDLVAAADPARLVGPDAPTTRDDWAAAGVDTWAGRAGCDSAPPGGDALTVLFDDLRTLGIVFDAQLRAEKVVSQLQATVDRLAGEAAHRGADQHTVWVYGGADVVFDDTSVVDAILRATGVTVASGSPDEIVAADPDTIWVITPRGADPATAGAVLRAEIEADPAFAGVTAVEQGSFVITPAAEVAASPRLVDGMQALVDALATA